MIATKNPAARLATSAPLPTGRGYRAPALYDRLTHARERHAAHETLCREAKAKPAWLYEARSKGRPLPDDRLHAAIVEGIRAGYVTPEVLVDFYGEQFALYRAMMPGAAEATFTDTARESAEALDAIAVARVCPSPENNAHASRESLEAAVVLTAHAKRLQNGSAA